MKRCDVAVIGAGPYGLSVTAHLRAHGVETAVFGEPMSFWSRQMPRGMFLRSPWPASSLSDPDGKFTLDAYREQGKKSFSAPVPLEHFVDYGRWFQCKAAADVEGRKVTGIEKNGSFRITLEDGEKVSASRVVVAAGIGSFPHRPKQFDEIPSELASHSCEHRDLAPFGGRKVIVIGGGQSALESTALLHEAGAEVEVLVRERRVIWLRQRLHTLRPMERLLYAPADVGPAGLSQLVARPNWYRLLPRPLQDKWAVRAIRPAGAAWLMSRVNGVPITTERSVASATRMGDQVKLRLDDGSERVADHVLLATGYRVDISRYDFLDRQLLHSIDQVGGYPRLNSGFECSLPGLHFVGAPAAWSFGPLMRFVVGTEFTAPAVARGIVGHRE